MTIGIRATRPEVLDQVESRLPPGWRPSRAKVVDRLFSIVAGASDPGSTVRRYWVVYSDFQQVARTMDPQEAFRMMAGDLSHSVAILAPRHVFVHAGVVGWRGRALMLPGRTLAGKSTLVAALVRAGATYYSDEWAVLDRQGRVHPFPRPLSIRRSQAEGGGESAVPVEALGGRAGTSPLPIGLVVLTRFDPRRRWKPRRLSAGRGTLALLEHAVQTHRDPARVLGALRHVVARAPVLKGLRGQAEDAAVELLARLDAGPAA